jgi:hypothetical protein
MMRRVSAVVFAVLLMATLSPPAAQPSDAFGDPFADLPDNGPADADGSAATDDASDGSEEPVVQPLRSTLGPPETAVELTGELGYAPTLHFAWQEAEQDADDTDGEYSGPAVVGSDPSAYLDLTVSRGLLSFVGRVSATAPADATGNSGTAPLRVRELYARRLGQHTDLTVGHFDLSWSSFDLFPVINFLRGSGMRFVSEKDTAGVTGARLIAYVGPVSAEAVVVPLPPARASELAEAASVFGYSPYPEDLAVTFTEAQPARSLEEVHLAGRLGVSLGPAAVYVAGYRGYPTRDVRESLTSFDATAAQDGEDPLSMEVTTVRPMINTAAGVVSVEVLGAVVDAEAAFTWDDRVTVLMDNELPPPGGTVTDRAVVTAHTLAVSGRLDWKLLPKTRLLAEVSEFFVIDQPDSLDKAALPGSTLFTGVDILMSTNGAELGLTAGPIYDWAGRELTMVGRIRADLLNGVTSELTAVYLTVGDERAATTDFALATDHDVLVSLSVAYSF